MLLFLTSELYKLNLWVKLRVCVKHIFIHKNWSIFCKALKTNAPSVCSLKFAVLPYRPFLFVISLLE